MQEIQYNPANKWLRANTSDVQFSLEQTKEHGCGYLQVMVLNLESIMMILIPQLAILGFTLHLQKHLLNIVTRDSV